MPFADLQAAGVDTTRMGPIRFGSDAPGSLRVDEIRLVKAGSGFSLGAPNFGRSIENRQPVWATMWPFLKNTILLNVFAILFTWVLALPIGIYSATHPYSTSDKVFGFTAYNGAWPSRRSSSRCCCSTPPTLTYDFSPDHLFYELFPIGGLTSANYYETGTLGAHDGRRPPPGAAGHRAGHRGHGRPGAGAAGGSSWTRATCPL